MTIQEILKGESKNTEFKAELPVSAIREMIVNAVCHRNYQDNSCIQIAIYDNRVEVTSPGMLYGGLTLEEALNGRSKIRNRAIAEVFSRMELIEEWGTGIRRGWLIPPQNVF